jgi:hypothetical protein
MCGIGRGDDVCILEEETTRYPTEGRTHQGKSDEDVAALDH